MRKAVVVVLALASGASNAMFDGFPATTFRTGNDFQQLPRVSAVNYVIGVLDATLLVSATFCLPDEATAGQLTDVATQYIAKRPERRHQGAALLVREAMADAFPCSASR